MFYEDKFHDECAVFGIYGNEKAAELAKDGLYMQQHRGQEFSGIASTDGSSLFFYKGEGLVRSIFTPEVLARLPGHAAIGHNRYSTSGPKTKNNAQPHQVVSKKGIEVMGCSNGDLPWYDELRERIMGAGYDLKTHNDGELIVALIALHLDTGCDMLTAIQKAISELEDGAYSCVVLTKDALWAFRDSHGFRPLALGRLGTSYVIASETCAFDVMGTIYIRDVFPGQIIRIDQGGERSFMYKYAHELPRLSFCEFEYIYFARPDSKIFGVPVSQVRRRLGAKLWELHPVEADIVVGIPDSARQAAIGFSQASGILLEEGLIRHHYALREFIQPEQEVRDIESKYKHNPDREIVSGKRVVLVDDSIVRGTASRKLVRMLRMAEAKEVHYRVSSPPIISSCFMGIDTPDRNKLIASTHTIEEISDEIEADSLGYLTLEALYECLPEKDKYCSACFTGKYPIKIPAYKFQT